MGVANKQCAVLKCCSRLGSVQISEFAKVRGSAQAFMCERGADFQHDSCSRASVVLILDMEAPQGLLQSPI